MAGCDNMMCVSNTPSAPTNEQEPTTSIEYLKDNSNKNLESNLQDNFYFYIDCYFVCRVGR